VTNKTISGSNNTITNVPMASASGTLPVANGGTGLTSPGASGNILTSNGTTWTSASASQPPTLSVYEVQPNIAYGTALFLRNGSTVTWRVDSSNENILRITTSYNHGVVTGQKVRFITSGDYSPISSGSYSATVESSTVMRFTISNFWGPDGRGASGNVSVYFPFVKITKTAHGLVGGSISNLSFDNGVTFVNVNVDFILNPNEFFIDTSTYVQFSPTIASTASADVSVNVLQKPTNTFTWTKPTGCKKIIVEVQAGGGCGNSSSAGSVSGAYASKFIDVTSISSVAVSVGTGGVETAQTGGTSSFGSFVTCTGGGGTAGGGGLATGGDINVNGSRAIVADSGVYNAGTPLGTGFQKISAGTSNGAQSGYGYSAGGWGSVSGGPTVAGNGVVRVMEFY
jgi:hypothetical protein